MICVWCLALWLSQGKPPRVRLVELGPGRGTLMADALRAAAASFPSFAAAVQDVRLVELSPALRAAQWRALECEPMLADAAAEKAAGDANPPGPRRRGLSRLLARSSGGGGGGGVPVTWHASLDEVPGRVRVRDGEGKSGDGPPEFVVEPEEEQQEEAKGEGGAASTDGGTRSPPRSAPPPSPSAPPCATIYIAHEFFDALPVHQFQYAPPRGRQRGQAAAADGCWLERMVDVQEGESGGGGDSGVVVGGSGGSGGANSSTNNGDSSNLHLRFVLSPSTTPAAALLVPRRLAALAPEQRALLQADAPPALTPSSSSSSSAAPEKTHQVRAIEVSAHGMAVAEALALRVGLNGSGGGALVIDYGRGAPYASSLTAVRGHRRHPHPLSLPGAADLSAWVDFSALAQAARESGAPVAVHGPVAQGAFLGALGALERAEQLAVAAADAAAAEKAAEGHEGMERAARDAAEAVAAAYRRLVGGGEQGMGETYKALAIVPAGGGGGAAAGGSGGGGASSPSSPPSIVAQPSPPPVGFGGGVADESMAGVGGL
jgi:NADH dehydrogenase [ubiquinone] 1 alpha subcomplex assembly factor 7